MRNLIAVPVIILSVTLQSAVVSRLTLLTGFGDLPLVMLAAWALQEHVDSSWHWAVALGVLVGFISALPWYVPLLSYLVVVGLAQTPQRRVWQAPLLAMFSVAFVGTVILNMLTYVTLRIGGVIMPVEGVLGLLVLPGVLLNMLLAIPIYAIMRDLSRWVYPTPEVE